LRIKYKYRNKKKKDNKGPPEKTFKNKVTMTYFKDEEKWREGRQKKNKRMSKK
jgi:hypothetical protein